MSANRATGALVLTAFLVTACGTTVPQNAIGTAPSGAEGAMGGVAAPGPAGTTPEAALPQGPAGRGSQPDAGSASGGSAPIAAVGGSTTVRVVAGKALVRLGVVYLKGLDQAYKAAGASSSAGDSKATYEAVIADVNKRQSDRIKLEASYFAIDASSSQPREQQLASACSAFTQDQHVDAVVSFTSGASGSFAQCLLRKGVPLVDGFPTASAGAGVFAAAPNLWAPSQLSLDRVAALQATYLSQQHWAQKRWPAASQCAATTEPRIGVVTFDRPDWRQAFEKMMAPAFKAAGTPVYDVYYIAVEGNTAQQVSGAAAGAQNAVLKMSQDCVDHVVMFSNVAVDYLFMNVASQQKYTPQYGMSSLESPPVVVQNVVDKTQLHGALGPGWAPYADVNKPQLDAEAARPAAECVRVLRAAQLEPADNNAMLLALPSCEGPWLVTTAVTELLRHGGSGTVAQALSQFAGTYRAAGALGSQLSPRQRDGASAYRGFAFQDACTCFRYASPGRAIG